MKLISFCTADSYRIKALFEKLQETHTATLIRDTIHVVLNPDKEVFIFPYGIVVTWDMTDDEGRAFIATLSDYEMQPVPTLDTDRYEVHLGDSHKIVNDMIYIPSMDLLSKMAISHGIAQSAELGYFETVIQRSFKSTRKIPADLEKYGRINLSRRDIRRKMGEIFQERSSINLHADVLDLPEFFWEHPQLEPLYQMVANYLDIRSRVEVLNHRLDIMHELYDVLATEVNHQHSNRLEMTIIILIIFEVIISLLHYVFHII